MKKIILNTCATITLLFFVGLNVAAASVESDIASMERKLNNLERAVEKAKASQNYGQLERKVASTERAMENVIKRLSEAGADQTIISNAQARFQSLKDETETLTAAGKNVSTLNNGRREAGIELLTKMSKLTADVDAFISVANGMSGFESNHGLDKKLFNDTVNDVRALLEDKSLISHESSKKDYDRIVAMVNARGTWVDIKSSLRNWVNLIDTYSGSKYEDEHYTTMESYRANIKVVVDEDWFVVARTLVDNAEMKQKYSDLEQSFKDARIKYVE